MLLHIYYALKLKLYTIVLKDFYVSKLGLVPFNYNKYEIYFKLYPHTIIVNRTKYVVFYLIDSINLIFDI